jgi:hypothetical protein
VGIFPQGAQFIAISQGRKDQSGAVRAPPICKYPVGEGAKRVLIFFIL